MKKLIGYLAWDFSDNTPMSGTRRFKVWTTEREASRAIPKGSNRYGIKPIYVEIEE